MTIWAYGLAGGQTPMAERAEPLSVGESRDDAGVAVLASLFGGRRRIGSVGRVSKCRQDTVLPPKNPVQLVPCHSGAATEGYESEPCEFWIVVWCERVVRDSHRVEILAREHIGPCDGVMLILMFCSGSSKDNRIRNWCGFCKGFVQIVHPSFVLPGRTRMMFRQDIKF